MNEYRPLRIVMADDHPIFRDGFQLLFNGQKELELVGTAENGKQLLEEVEHLLPDLVITDIQMPVMDGIQACRVIKEKFPEIQVIGLTMFNEDKLIVDMLEAGAKGYLLKNTTKGELLQAAKAVYAGGTYYCMATSVKLSRLIAQSKFDPYKAVKKPVFTERELEVIHLVCEQNTNKEIADMLRISIRTVETHRENIQDKIGARNSIGIAIYAMKHGLYRSGESVE